MTTGRVVQLQPAGAVSGTRGQIMQLLPQGSPPPNATRGRIMQLSPQGEALPPPPAATTGRIILLVPSANPLPGVTCYVWDGTTLNPAIRASAWNGSSLDWVTP